MGAPWLIGSFLGGRCVKPPRAFSSNEQFQTFLQVDDVAEFHNASPQDIGLRPRREAHQIPQVLHHSLPEDHAYLRPFPGSEEKPHRVQLLAQ